jgi:hypothetical protein
MKQPPEIEVYELELGSYGEAPRWGRQLFLVSLILLLCIVGITGAWIWLMMPVSHV